MTQSNEIEIERPAHADDMLAQAEGQVEIALLWARRERPDLSSVFISMAKLMLLEGHGKGSESEFWVLTTRSAIAEIERKPLLALKCATQAHELAKTIFAGDKVKMAIASGNLGKAVAVQGDPEEARKLLSQGIFGLSEASWQTSPDRSPRLQKYLGEAFIEFARAIQQLPPRPRQAK